MWQKAVTVGGGGGNCVVEYGYRVENLTKYDSNSHKITTGFKPKKILIAYSYNGSQLWRYQDVYDEDVSGSSYTEYYGTATGTAQASTTTPSLPNSTVNNAINSIENDGFVVGSSWVSNVYNITYMAFG